MLMDVRFWYDDFANRGRGSKRKKHLVGRRAIELIMRQAELETVSRV